jgi:hypothetical protein
MRTYLLIASLACAPMVLRAQAANISRLPLLDPLPKTAFCRTDTSAALAQSGIAKLFTIQLSDASSHRAISVGISSAGAPVNLTSIMGAKDGEKGASETLSAFFGSTGHVQRGTRHAYTVGFPSKVSEDHKEGLLASDTAAAERLVAAVRQRCRV